MKKLVKKNPRELSFTIFETIVAVGLLMAFALEMAAGQGNIVNKVEYARRSNEAMWLAKRIMSQVEYNYQTMELKELETTTSYKDKTFDGLDRETEFDYLYSVDIKEWKFPLFDFLLNGGMPNEEDEDDPTKAEKEPPAGGIPGMDAILEQIFKGHIMKVAYVEVSWPDGARRDSVSLTYLLTNNKALDEFLLTKKSVFDGVIKKSLGVAGQQQQLPAAGPNCTPSDPPDSTDIAGGGGCMRPDGSIRKPDGSIYAQDGTMIQPPIPPQTTGGGGGQGGANPPPPTNPNMPVQ